jgi:hypothetical protein
MRLAPEERHLIGRRWLGKYLCLNGTLETLQRLDECQRKQFGFSILKPA